MRLGHPFTMMKSHNKSQEKKKKEKKRVTTFGKAMKLETPWVGSLAVYLFVTCKWMTWLINMRSRSSF